jgi:alkylhydroperoxidase family enzyme
MSETKRSSIPPRRSLSAWLRLQKAFTRRALTKILRREAEPPAGLDVLAHVPLAAGGYGMLEAALARSRAVHPRLAELARLRAATIHGCPW